jgi:aspartate-semialdehyde dehydrogenase
VSASRGWSVSLVGATGAVGEEILRVLEERRFPVLELRAFASGESEGREVEFQGAEVAVERIDPGRVGDVDLVFCAASGVLESLRPALREAGPRIVDASGALELDLAVPLYQRGATRAPLSGTEIAIPRGIVAGLGVVLGPLHEELGLERLTVVALESASGAGRRGAGELSEQTVHLLNAMTGEAGEAETFSQPLAFDCLPLVGTLLPESGESSEERRLGHVVRRLLSAPALPVETTRVRVPVFGGSLACVHATLARSASTARVRELWEKREGVEVVEGEVLPTPRTTIGRDELVVGRVRTPEGDGGGPGIAFVLAMDDLRRGAALAAVEAAELFTAN